MAKVAREQRLDVFHVHYAVPHATAAYLAVQMLGGPAAAPRIVTTLHGTDTTLLGQDPSYREAIQHALSQSDTITTVSESLRLETLTTFGLIRHVEVIPNFFIPSERIRTRADVRRDLGIGEDEFLIVHASNVRPLKRIDLLLQAFAAMNGERPARLLILAGDTFASHQHLLDASPARERVIVCEDVLHVEDYLGASDAGLYTSESESFGLSILETQFHAKPVVAFRVGGIPEVVVDTQTGFLHAFGDVEALAASLDQLAASPELARQMGNAAQQQARARFSADRVVPCYQAVYERLIS
jgi:N-acetyl-alpha-D-glucosaminyl L-malate synthase BshA